MTLKPFWRGISGIFGSTVYALNIEGWQWTYTPQPARSMWFCLKHTSERTQQSRSHSTRQAPRRWQGSYLILTSDCSTRIRLTSKEKPEESGAILWKLSQQLQGETGGGYYIRGMQSFWPFPILHEELICLWSLLFVFVAKIKVVFLFTFIQYFAKSNKVILFF